MIISLDKSYKSLNPFTSDPIGDFTVITGKNGSGKSQLIELFIAIQAHYQNPQYTYTATFKITPELKNIQIEGIPLGNTQNIKADVIQKQIDESLQTYNAIPTQMRQFILDLVKSGFDVKNIQANYSIAPFVKGNTLTDQNNFLRGLAISLAGVTHTHYNDINIDFLNNMAFVTQKLGEWKKAITTGLSVANYLGKSFLNLDRNDFITVPLDETFFTNSSPFTVQIENLFYGYARKRFTNEMNYVRATTYKLKNDSISDEEFINQYPPPWDIINAFLHDLDLKLRVVGIKPEEFAPEMDFNIHLFNVLDKKAILFGDLSSGEKIIVGLIVRLFVTERYKGELLFPDCIIFDEPDAYLHPEMSSLLIRVLHEIFVKKLGIKVIFTTHSPSTVALAPEESIFELRNSPETTLSKISKDDALSILTENLPLLSIDYNNHKQVFVESPTDQYYYQIVFNTLMFKKETTFNLYFITTGFGKGNCDQVIKLTEDLRAAGNKTSYGIVDWDLKYSGSGNIYVHGENGRYSVENFLLDPIYLTILFLDQGGANGIYELGFDRAYPQYKIFEESAQRLQVIIDWFINKLSTKFRDFSDKSMISLNYSVEKGLMITTWYLHFPGHTLLERIREIFPSLKAFTELKLLRMLTEIMIKCYPYIPKESYDLIKRISTDKNK